MASQLDWVTQTGVFRLAASGGRLEGLKAQRAGRRAETMPDGRTWQEKEKSALNHSGLALLLVVKTWVDVLDSLMTYLLSIKAARQNIECPLLSATQGAAYHMA